MKIIKPQVEIIPQSDGVQGMLEQIEIAGRICYKSEDKITECSAKEFVERMVKSRHWAMLEHGTVYLQITEPVFEPSDLDYFYSNNKYSRVYRHITPDDLSSHYIPNRMKTFYVTTNYRVLVENNRLDDLKYICEPTEFHEKRVTVKFTTQIAITREINRHRVDSMAEESTRYCNFYKDKFGNEITISKPDWIDEKDIPTEPNLFDYCGLIYNKADNDNMTVIDYWLFANLASEYSYMNLIRLGWKAEQARTILPLDLKSELIHTAFVSDWEHFFELRCANSAHVDARYLADILKEKFIQTNIIKS